MPRYFACLFACLVTVVLAPGATAADIKVMISAGFFSVYKELGPAFEKSTGHKLATTRGPSVGDSPEAIPTRLARGEQADVVIMDGVGVDLLDQRERIPGRHPPGRHEQPEKSARRNTGEQPPAHPQTAPAAPHAGARPLSQGPGAARFGGGGQ